MPYDSVRRFSVSCRLTPRYCASSTNCVSIWLAVTPMNVFENALTSYDPVNVTSVCSARVSISNPGRSRVLRYVPLSFNVIRDPGTDQPSPYSEFAVRSEAYVWYQWIDSSILPISHDPPMCSQSSVFGVSVKVKSSFGTTVGGSLKTL